MTSEYGSSDDNSAKDNARLNSKGVTIASQPDRLQAGRDFAPLRPDDDVADYLLDARREVEALLSEFTRLSSDSPARLTSAIRYSLLAPGKRLRPILAIVAAELCGGKRKEVGPVCVALESIHVYSLIHDDLPAMDDDDLRRGLPTCHKRFDEATAILAGDALLTFAFETLAARIDDPEVARRCVLSLSKAAGPCGMVGGQTDDVVWSSAVRKSPETIDLLCELTSSPEEQVDVDMRRNAFLTRFLYKIHRRKTGALIVSALELGALTAKASERQLEAFREYGRHLGQAFQISDDLLDEFGDERKLGKRAQKDKDAGKLTYVSLLGVEETKRALCESVEKAKKALLDASDVFDVDSLAFRTAMYLVDFTARRER